MQTNRLDKNDFVPHAPTEVGVQVRVHHCKDGKNNDRLYIRRQEDGSIIAYCHHCGASGFYSSSGNRRLSNMVDEYNRRKAARLNDKTDTLTLPEDTEFDFKKWPVAATSWILQYGITEKEVHDARIGYSKYFGRVILPTFMEDGKLVRWQGRRIQGITDKSERESYLAEKGFRKTILKYDTKSSKGCTKADCLQALKSKRSHTTTDTKRCLVIVEDMLSAIKVSRLHDALPLSTANVKIKDLTKFKNYDRIYIFLDNDNDQVKANQLRLKSALELVYPEVILITQDKDAKAHSMAELERLLLDTPTGEYNDGD